MEPKFDLLGDPIPETRGKPGRRGHIAIAENVNKVSNLLASGVSVARIAKEIGITAPCLRKHYFANYKVKANAARKRAIADMSAKMLLLLDAQCQKGNVSAIRTMLQEMDRIERDLFEDEVGKPEKAAPAPGLKRQRELSGLEADEALEQELMQEVDERLH